MSRNLERIFKTFKKVKKKKNFIDNFKDIFHLIRRESPRAEKLYSQ